MLIKLVLNQNISGGLPNNLESIIINLIDAIPQDDAMLGDLNNDGALNVLDVINLVNIILSNDYTNEQLLLADINQDGTINIIDIVQLVNIILD